MTTDHYATLDVVPTATAAEVRAAYLRLLRTHHPDRNPSPEAAERTQGIIAAFKVLGNFDRRNRYDWDRRRDREASEAAAAPRPVSRAALAAGAMAIVAIGGLWWKPDTASKPQTAGPNNVTISAPVATPRPIPAKDSVTSKAVPPKPVVPVVAADRPVEPVVAPRSDRKSVQKQVSRTAKVAASDPPIELAEREAPIVSPPKVAAKPGGGAPSTDLAAIDQFVMNYYGQSWRYGDAAKRSALAQSRADFIVRRRTCAADACIRAAYLGLMRDVSTIVESNGPTRR